MSQILHVRTTNNTSMRFGDDFGWSFGDTILSVWSLDKKVRHFFPFATIDRATITNE